MESNFQKSLKLVLVHEGGYVNHPSDPGGATNKGVTLETFRRYVKPSGTIADLKAITAAQLATVYRNQYWNKCNCDNLPSGLDYAVFDFAVNSGPNRAAKYLQAVLGVTEDGNIGIGTIGAVKDVASAIKGLCAKRMAFLRGLKTWGTFGKGWERRVIAVRADALAMVGAQPAAQPIPAETKPATPASKPSAWVAFFKAIMALFGVKK